MTTRRKKPSVAFWASLVVVVLLVAYPLSFGPACWWFTRSPDEMAGQDGDLLVKEVDLRGSSGRRASRFYWPFGWLAVYGPAPVSMAVRTYATLFVGSVDLPSAQEGRYFTVRWR